MQLSPSDPDIQTIVARITNGDLDLQPDFQRGEVWSTQKKRRLIDSILRNWYIPPIHTVVVPDTNKQDVLDGQQRLVAIRDFVHGDYPVDGNIPPYDDSVTRLNGLFYNELPADARRLFDSFTIRVMRVTDYRPEEPGELFFRLNAITNVTAAEQRNAFYGPVRHQVKSLVSFFEAQGNSSSSLGFSNSRMAYDDVLSKFLCTLEGGSLAIKLTANVVSDRFRTNYPFDHDVTYTAEETIRLFSFFRESSIGIKFNKATLLSWLLFLSAFVSHNKVGFMKNHNSLLRKFESMRSSSNLGILSLMGDSPPRFSPKVWEDVLLIYTDRSTSRVLDISSVILRDYILHFYFYCISERNTFDIPLNSEKRKLLERTARRLETLGESSVERELEGMLSPTNWGPLR